MTPEEFLRAILTGQQIDPDEGAIPWESMTLTEVSLENFTFDELWPAIYKRLVWDIVPDSKIPAFSTGLGILNGSDIGNDVEKADADLRRAQLLPIAEEVTRLASAAGEIISRAKMVDSDGTDSLGRGDTLVMDPEKDYTREVLSGTLAVLANLLALDLITYGKAVTGE